MTGTVGNDTFTADHLTLGASDTINGGAGIDTLNYTDASTTGVAPLGLVQNVEFINIRNVNGSAVVAAVNAVAEKATVTFNSVTVAGVVNGATVNSTTITIAGRVATLTGAAAAGGGAAASTADTVYTPAAIAAAFAAAAAVTPAAGTVGITASTALVNYTIAAGTPAAGTAVLESTVAGNVTNLTTAISTGVAPAVSVVDGVVGTTGTTGGVGIALNVNASNFAGATDFNTNLSTNVVNFTNLVAGQKVGLIGNGAAVLGNVSAAYGAGVTATVVNVSGGVGPTGSTAPTVTLSGPTVLNTATLNSIGSVANTLGGVALGGNTTALTVNADARLTAGNITGFNGTTSTITVKGAAAGTATAAAVNLGTIEATTVKTIDASGLTVGGVAAVLNSNQTITFTGGQGQDIVTTGSVLTTGLVNAGAGTTDRLIVSDSLHVTSTTGKLYTNFEQLQVNDGVSVDLAQLASTNTIDTIRINDGANSTGVTNLTATQAANVTIVAANATGVITIGVKDATTAGQVDTVKASLVNTNAAGTAGVAVDLTAMALAGVEKLELTTTGATTAASGAVTFTTATALSLDSIKLTSAAAGNVITVDGGHLASNLAIDASASTGSVTLSAAAYTNGTTGALLTGGSSFDILLGASAKADKIIGGAGNDVIAGSALTGTVVAGTATAIGAIGTVSAIGASTASDILTGGAGKDLFILGINSTAATISSITDLDLGGTTLALGQDQIVLKMASASAMTIVTLTTAQQTAVTAAVDLATALNLVAAATDAPTNNGTAQFTFGTDTYLFVNSATSSTNYVAGTDEVIKITGVVGTLDASDIVFLA